MRREATIREIEEGLVDGVRRYPSVTLLCLINREYVRIRNLPSSHQGGFRDSRLKVSALAKLADYAIRHSNPHRQLAKRRPSVETLVDLALHRLAADPYGSEEIEMRGNMYHFVVRTGAAQFPLQYDSDYQFARGLLLFGEAPKRVSPAASAFDFASLFESDYGCSLAEFVQVCFCFWAWSISDHYRWSRQGLHRARNDGVALPPDDVVDRILKKTAATPASIRECHEQVASTDQRFSGYDLNPLMQFPIARPWGDEDEERSKFVVPIPPFLQARCSNGIYYDFLSSRGGEFTKWFGHVYEAYIGMLLEQSSPPRLFTEKEIKQTYGRKRQKKIPDFVWLDGDCAVLIECKALRLNRVSLTSTSDEHLQCALNQFYKGMRQLSEFETAIRERRPGLEELNHCKQFFCVLVTFEPIWQINAPVGRDYLAMSVAEDSRPIPETWIAFSTSMVEDLQPYLRRGFQLQEACRHLLGKETEAEAFNKVREAQSVDPTDSLLTNAFRSFLNRTGL